MDWINLFLKVYLRKPRANFGIQQLRKLDYSEKSPQSNLLDSLKGTPNLSSKSQLVSYFVNPIPVKSKQVPLVTSQIVPTMANRYAPLALPANLNAMPVDYSTKTNSLGMMMITQPDNTFNGLNIFVI